MGCNLPRSLSRERTFQYPFSLYVVAVLLGEVVSCRIRIDSILDYLDEEDILAASGLSESSGNVISFQGYESYLSSDPPEHLRTQIEVEIRRIMTPIGCGLVPVEQISEIVWRLQMITFKHYIQVSA
jgi:hypothetical protein